MKSAFGGAFSLWTVNWRHRDLILRMIRREIAGRYLGSMLGAAWAVLQPLVMLCVFTFAFSVVFQSRWTSATGVEAPTSFPVAMFLGFIIFTLFSESLNRAPLIVLGNTTYVKRTVFPLEILATVALGAALFHFAMAFLVWLGLLLVLHRAVAWTILLLPLVLLPLVLLIAGLVWLLASLGVYVRDLAQVIGPTIMASLFLSPVFYPADAVPLPFRTWMYANPLTGIIEQARKVAIFGELPDWPLLAASFVLGLAAAHLGFLWFTRTRQGFADVL